MNCRNCGAAAERLAGKDYFRCEYCGSFTFPPESDEGVRILSQTALRAGCSICQEPLVEASVSGVPARFCRSCRGILLSNRAFSEVLEIRRTHPASGRPQPREIPQEDLERAIHCPHCRERMHVHPYYGPGNAVIDTCGECLLIWLDHSELSVIADARRTVR